MRSILGLCFYLLLMCENAHATKTTLKLGVHPLHNPQKIIEVFTPLVNYLNTNSKNFYIELVTSKDYADYNSKIKIKYFDILSPNPYQTVKAKKYSYKVIGKWGNDELFRGIFLVRVDSGIKSLADLRDKKISFPAPTALAATLMPQELLYSKYKYLPEKSYKQFFVGNQESSIMAAYNKTADVGVTWLPPWKLMQKENPEISKTLRALATTEKLPSNSIMIKNDVNVEIVNELRKLLLSLNQGTDGGKILDSIGISHFEAANEKTYIPVEKFIIKYEKDIGEISW